MKFILFFILTFLGCEFLVAQTYLQWVRQDGGASSDGSRTVAVDPTGNVYVGGHFTGTVDFNPSPSVTFNLTSNGLEDIFIQKLDPNGNFIWAVSFGGTASDYASDIQIDASGNVLTTGTFRAATVDFDPSSGGITNLTGSGWEVFVQKLDQNGNFIWAKRMGGSSTDWGTAIATDPSGNVYTCGFFFNTGGDYDPGAGTATLNSVGLHDMFIQKMDPSGNFLWVKSWGSTGEDGCSELAVDASGNCYITGHFSGSVDVDPGGGVANRTTTGVADVFVEKLDANGDFVWCKTVGGSGEDVSNGITLDNSGNPIITGYFSGTCDFDPGAGVSNKTSNGLEDVFIVKLNTIGDLLWANSMGGTGTDVGESIDSDPNGDIYTVGKMSGSADFNPNASVYTLNSNGLTDIFVSKLSSTGSFIWSFSEGSTGDDLAWSVAVNDIDVVHLSGHFTSTVDFEPGSSVFNLTSNGGIDAFVQKLLTSILLPVQNLDFQATAIQNRLIQLDWETLSEYNTDKFEVYRSKDGQNWEYVSTKESIGSSTTLQNYQSNDYQPYFGLSYYKLKQFDLNGVFYTSEIRSVWLDSDISNEEVVVFPNPASHTIIVSSKDINEHDLMIVDPLGRIVKQSISQLSEDKLLINIEQLATGSYSLVLGQKRISFMKY